VAHSAGGWLGRAFVGDPKYRERFGGVGEGPEVRHNPAVASLVTLGAPHRPPPPNTPAKDMTGGALSWVDTTYPGAFFPGVRYVTVAGRAVRGQPRPDRSAPRTLSSYAHDSYLQVRTLGAMPLTGCHADSTVTYPGSEEVGGLGEWVGHTASIPGVL